MKREKLNYVGAINMSKGVKIGDYYLQSLGTNEKSHHNSVIVNLCKDEKLENIDLTTIYNIDNFITIVKKHNGYAYTEEQLDQFNNDLYDMVDTLKEEEDMTKGAYMIIKNLHTYDYVEELKSEQVPSLFSVLEELRKSLIYPDHLSQEKEDDGEEMFTPNEDMSRLQRIFNRRVGHEGMEIVKQLANNDMLRLQEHYVREDDTEHVTKLQEIVLCQMSLIKDLRKRVKNLEKKEGK